MPRRRGALRAFGGRFAIALVLAVSLMVGAVVAVNYVINVKLNSVSRVGLHTAAASGGPINFLLVGSDSRAFTNGNKDAQQHFGTDQSNGGQRSDTLMVVRVDPDHHKTVVVSFPRDMWVNIPGQGAAKINSAYNDGPQRVIDTLKADYNIQINHFIRVDFQSFQGVVDAIGTVPVYVPWQARDDLTGLYTPSPGCESLTGADALAYVRSRDLQYYSQSKKRWMAADPVPDINRIDRQQQFIKQLAGIAVQRSLRDPLTGNKILNRVLKNLTIDKGLTKDDILTLVDAFRTINPKDSGQVLFTKIPWSEGPNLGGQNVLYLKEPDADAVLARLGGSVVPANVAIITNSTSRPSGLGSSGTTGGTTGTTSGTTGTTSGTTGTTAPSGSTSTTMLPGGTSSTLPPSALTPPASTPSVSSTPSAENISLFGPPAPKFSPCS
jgi:polyisoprenyl-teichoic acid--peptidoglycan teichoic acid transferase